MYFINPLDLKCLEIQNQGDEDMLSQSQIRHKCFINENELLLLIRVKNMAVLYVVCYLNNFNFLKYFCMTDLSYGLVAKQVGMFSGCSVHNLKSIWSVCRALAMLTNSASSLACRIDHR